MALLTYDGTARDHEVIPQVLKMGKNKKPMHRQVLKPARTVFKTISTFNLRGMHFPAGQKLSVSDKDAVKKAAALGCFDVEIVPGEPVSFDKEWLETALQGERVRMGKADASAPEPDTGKKAEPEFSDDGLDAMKRTDLIRLASSRGLSVNLSMTKVQIVEMLRAHAAPALAEAEEEGGDLDPDSMTVELE